MTAVRRTYDEFLAELTTRFGEDRMKWSFVCPNCGDICSLADLTQALADNPRKSQGEPIVAGQILGQECIGRVAGGGPRGCDWAAYGLFRGPEFVIYPDGTEVPCFSMAPAAAA